MVEDQGRDSAVDMSRRAFVGRTEVEVRRDPTLGITVREQWRRQRVANPDHGVTPPHAFARFGHPNAKRSVKLTFAQSGDRRIDIPLDLGDGLRVRLGPNGGVDEGAHRIGEWFVDCA